MQEIWKPVKGFEQSHLVNIKGEVKTISRKVPCKGGKFRTLKSRLLKSEIDNYGYVRFTLSFNNINKHIFQHRLIAIHFIPNPENKPYINHIDGVKTNNVVSNLEWCTQAENNQHAYDIGLKKIGEKQRKQCSALGKKEAKKVIDTKTGKIFNRMTDAANHLGFCLPYFSDMLNGKERNKTNFVFYKD